MIRRNECISVIQLSLFAVDNVVITMAKRFICFFVVIFQFLSTNGKLRYCDRVFDLLNRTDESFSTCHWQDTGHVSDLDTCPGGVTCRGQCVPYHLWCKPDHGTPHVTQCGSLLSAPDTCLNKTFWRHQPCDEDPDTARSQARRCSGAVLS